MPDSQSPSSHKPTETYTFDDLISWSNKTLHGWQKDALRRVLLSGELSESDIDELALLAKLPHSSSPPTEENQVPIEATITHVQTSGVVSPRVVLRSVKDIQGVNALCEGPIVFAAEGLTVVYGENASGKSGLTRILKKTCRAVVPGGPVRSNIFESARAEPARAVIEFEMDGVPGSVAWNDGQPVTAALREITVLDSVCARQLVAKQRVLSYTPELLASFKLLSEACDGVSKRLQAEIQSLGVAPTSIEELRASVDTESPVGKFLTTLSKSSKAATLQDLSRWSEDDARRLEDIRLALKGDPERQLKLVEARIRKVRSFQALLDGLYEAVGDEACKGFVRKTEEADEAADAARVAQQAFSAESELDGIGTPAWRRLWDSARTYSEELAFPEKEFPNIEDGARCVLCQQDLVAAAKKRLTSFESFVIGDIQKTADKAKRARDLALTAMEKIEIPLNARRAVDDLGALDALQQEALRHAIVAVKLRRRRLVRTASLAATAIDISLPDIPDLENFQKELIVEGQNLRNAADDNKRTEMVRESEELGARAALSPFLKTVEQEIERLQAVARLQLALDECKTGPITRQQGVAEKKIVTLRLQETFTENLLDLGFSETPVEMKAGLGQSGERPYGVNIPASTKAPAVEVLSEGECSCVALAGLLAELSTTKNLSGLVLDDPVTSLDHNYRERVATRLCMEAKERQVIIFTHDIVFLFMLEKYAKNLTVPIETLSLRRGGSLGGHGRVEPEPPWVIMKVNARIKRLRREVSVARGLLAEDDRTPYDHEASRIYQNLRQAWERSVEEVLLNGAVLRFDDSVHTQPLRKVADDLTLADIQMVDTSMAYCSGFVHDTARSVPARCPGPNVIESDIKKLEVWAKEIRARRA